MEDIKIPEILVRTVNQKSNISLSSNIQGVQNITFSEVLTSISGNQIVQNLGIQGGNISLDFLTLPNVTTKALESDSKSNSQNDKNSSTSIKTDTHKNHQTMIFSEYSPQKPVEIQDENLMFENLPENEKKYNLNKEHHIKKDDDENYYIDDDEKKKTDEKEKTEDVEDEIDSSDLPDDAICYDNEPIENEEDNREKKRQFAQKRQNKKYSSRNLLNFEILKILEQYKLTKPSFDLSNVNINSREYISWIKDILNQAKEKNLENLDAFKLSKYIVSPHKIPYTDKEIFHQMLSNVFNKKISTISSDFTVSLEKSSLEIMYKIFPENMFEGFIKKTFIHSQKRKDRKNVSSAVNKLINGANLTEKEASVLSKSFKDNFSKENLSVLKDMFKGDYEKYSIEKIHEIVSKLHYKKNIPSGFVGSLYEIFFDSMENGQKETSKQIIRFLENYSKGKDFDEGEAKIISKLISTKYFNDNGLNNNRINQIFSNIINKKEIEYFSLDLISQISKKNIINYIPSKINKDVKDYLKFLPISSKEESDNLSSEFIFGGRVKVFGLKKTDIIKNPVLTIINFSNDETLLIRLDRDFYFNEVLRNGKYQVIGISFFAGENIINSDFREKRFRNNIDFLDFSLESPEINIFYFGTLKVFISQKTNSILRIEIKNDYKNFLEHRTTSLNSSQNIKKIKINPKLFKTKV